MVPSWEPTFAPASKTYTPLLEYINTFIPSVMLGTATLLKHYTGVEWENGAKHEIHRVAGQTLLVTQVNFSAFIWNDQQGRLAKAQV